MTRAEFFYFSGDTKLERAFLTAWPLKSCGCYDCTQNTYESSQGRFSILRLLFILHAPRVPFFSGGEKVTETARPSLVHLYTSAPGHWLHLHAMHTANLMQIPLEKSPTNQGLFVNYWTGGFKHIILWAWF
jgi:hypothetical protein